MKTLKDQVYCAEWYANTQARINTVVGSSSEDWITIKAAREDWLQNEIDQNFLEWIEEKYGIKLTPTEHGLSKEIVIIDEEKYVLFLLKYK